MKATIIEHAAKAFFGSAWANMQDNAVEGAETVNLSGCEILDVCPEVDPSAIHEAEQLIESTERLNKWHSSISMTIEEILELCKSNSDNCDRECTPEMFGHYLAMHAMGSGVGLESVTNELIKTPYAEDYSCEDFTKTPILEQDYS